MYARVSRYRGGAQELRRGFESVTDELQQLSGFHHAYFLTDADGSRGMSITLWDSREALDASAERAHQMRTQATEPSGATIESVESYEVALTAQAVAGSA